MKASRLTCFSRVSIAFGLLLLLLTGASAQPSQSANKDGNTWKQAGADAGLRLAFEQSIHQLSESGDGGYRGTNQAQKLDLEFSSREARLQSADRKAEVGFRLTGYGYGTQLQKPDAVKVTATGSRIEYQSPGITEWYVNESRGLEQGFTLPQRPGAPHNNQLLAIEIAVSGNLKPILAGKNIELRSDGRVVLNYTGLRAWDSTGRTLDARMTASLGRIRLEVADSKAIYPITVDPWIQQQKLTSSEGLTGDEFGWSVAVDGDTAVIGADLKNGSQGAAYVFTRSGNTWTQQQKLLPSDLGSSDEFGTSVAVNGNTVVVGALGAQGNIGEVGAAYVFTRSGTTWTQQQKLVAADPTVLANFGGSVAVSGDTAIIGADGINSFEGAAYVFTRTGSTWTQQQKLIASDHATGNVFGSSVDVDGNTAVVGATVNALAYGAAYVFTRSGTTWTEQQKLAAADAGPGFFGDSLSLAGDTVIIGANAKDSYLGAAYVFTRSGTTWSQQQKLSASDPGGNDLFGTSVSLSGDTAVVGAHQKNSSQGAAYVFTRSGTTWTQQQELTASDGVASDQFGRAVSISGNTILVGAAFENSEQGAAYVFTPYLSANVCPGHTTPAPCDQTNAFQIAIPNGTTTGGSPAKVVTQGTANLDFTLVSTSCANLTGPATCTATVKFAPIAPGVRIGAIELIDSSNNIASTTLIYGIGVAPALALTPGIITTVAGNGTSGFSGDNGPATSATLTLPQGVAVDSAGNFYIAGDDRIRKVDTGGTITTVAGNGTSGDSGDNGPATSAQLNPIELAVDGAGNLYIADIANNRIRRVDTTGTITTVAGTGINGFSGDNGPATSAKLAQPASIAVDGAGNFYIADLGNNRIRKVDTSGIITTVAGNGTFGFSGDNGPATSAKIAGPFGVAVDGAGNLYIADSGNNRIRKVDTSGIITTVAGDGTSSDSGDNGLATSAQLADPHGVAVDGAGNLYIANHRIRKVDTSGIITTVVGNGSPGYSGDNGPATSAQINFLNNVALDGAANLYVADRFNNRIRKVDVSISALSFGSVSVNGTSSPQSVSASNVGNAPLNFNSFAITPNFQIAAPTAGDCSTGSPLATGGNCNLRALFAPTVPGPLTGAFTLTDNAFNVTGATQSISLSGTTPLAISPTTLPAASPVTNYNVQLSATGGTPPYTFGAVNLPAGLSLNASNQIVGFCTASSSNVMLNVTDHAGGFASVGPLSVVCMAATNLAFTASSATTARFSESAQVQAVLTTTGNAPVAGKTVTFTLGAGGGTQTCSATTNSSGVATCQIIPTSAPGSYPLKAAFAGDTIYAPISTTINFAVTKETTTLALGFQSSTSGKNATITFTATLLFHKPTPVNPTGTVQILDSSNNVLGTGTLTSASTAQITITQRTPVSLSVHGVYSGDTNYSSSQTGTTNITIR